MVAFSCTSDQCCIKINLVDARVKAETPRPHKCVHCLRGPLSLAEDKVVPLLVLSKR